MPVRARETNDRPSESRIRQIIRKILNQEVRRLLDANSSVQSQVTTNTSNISAVVTVNNSQATEIDNLERRSAARNTSGITKTGQLSFDDLENIRRFSL